MGLPASFVFLVVIANTLLITPSLALTEDCKALLEIKRCLNDTQRFLSNWRASDHSPCNWTGITCHLRDHRVISINLGKMQLGGSISPSFMKLSRLQRLALHENKLHGLIPAEITTCMELRALYLRANYLQGGIPLDIGNLSHLTALDLSSNSLMGPIPPSIGLLIRLQFLNLSINFFSGDIPNVGVMSTFGNKSFLGNLNLCGLQIQKPCLDSLGFPAVLPHKNSESKKEAQSLNWNSRLRIALGSAHGLAYLHHDCCPRIVHRDIKSSNILLDENLEPRVSDFGLAKLLIDEDAHVTTVVTGTFGYLAPECLQNGGATEKSDVYSYGILLLELVTGKRPIDPSFIKRRSNIAHWMNTLVRESRLENIVDKTCTDVNMETVEAVLDIAARCTNPNPDDRPSMNRVSQMLEEIMLPCPSEFDDSHSDSC